MEKVLGNVVDSTQCGPKVLGLIFFKSKTNTFFLIQNKFHWHIYRLLCGRTVSEKVPRIPLFGLSLIHQLRLLGSQQHPQSKVLLTSFSTWGTENSLAEINLDSMRVIRGCDILLGQKLANTCSFVGGRIIVHKKKSREQNAAGRTR
jgi:hypothetical protein